MEQLNAAAIFRIAPGKMEEFKKRAAACIEAVRLKDKNTLQYKWYYNQERSECIVLEVYKNSGAVLEHMANLGPLLGNLLEISTLKLQVCGEPSAELKAASEGLDITYYSFEAGL
jgi:quinol monooxygenase YgiN